MDRRQQGFGGSSTVQPQAQPAQQQRQQQRQQRKPRRRLKPKPRSENTLVCLIQSMMGRKVVVELRNDVLLRGNLEDVDEFLNMSMSAVTYQTVEGGSRNYQSLYVKGRNVRYVHLPKTLDPAQAIEQHRQRLIQAKIRNAKERARVLGAGKRQAKGADAEASSDAQQLDDDGGEEEEEDGLEGYDGEGEVGYGADSPGAGAAGAGAAGGHGGLAALLDPRAAAARRQSSLAGATGSSEMAAAAAGEEDAGLGSGLYYSSSSSSSGEEAGEDDEAGDEAGDETARLRGSGQIPIRLGRPGAG